MSSSRTASADTADAPYEPILRAPSVAPADEAASAEVLITEQEVLFGTAAALPARRESIARRFVALMRRMFAASARASRPPRRDVPKRYEFLERALMGREMDRL
ncbi:hypothetical protein [Mycobacterium sp.]|uniref:hypothetical protein n=1 Tax=Mycobacterium sp. TaxID=1785 RepID=UPI003F99F789